MWIFNRELNSCELRRTAWECGTHPVNVDCYYYVATEYLIRHLFCCNQVKNILSELLPLNKIEKMTYLPAT